MSFREKAEKFKGELEKRHKESGERKDEGTMGSHIFNLEKLKEYMPNGVNIWRPKEGLHEIDIIPFFAGSQHPRDREGVPSYCVDVWVYRMVGALKLQFVSPSKTYKQTDPILEYIHRENLSKDEYKEKSAKRRVIYEIWCHDNQEEEEKGIQVWDVAHWLMERHLEKISLKPSDGGYIKFSHYNTGKRVVFSIESEGKWVDLSGTERDSVSYLGHRFIDRPGDGKIPDEILDTNFPLDEVIYMKPTYAEIYEAHYGKKYIEDGSTAPHAKRVTRMVPEPDTPLVDETPEGSCPDGGVFGASNDKREACAACEMWDACSDAAVAFYQDDTLPPDEEKSETSTTSKKKTIIRRKK